MQSTAEEGIQSGRRIFEACRYRLLNSLAGFLIGRNHADSRCCPQRQASRQAYGGNSQN